MPRYAQCLAFLSCLCLSGCLSSTSTWDLSQKAIAAMGGARNFEAVSTLVFSGGEGTRNRIGQRHDADSSEVEATLEGVTTTLDLAGQRAAYEYDVTLPSGFRQHRIEALTRHAGRSVGYSINDNGRMASSPGGLFSWGPQNSPATPLRRNPVTLLLDAARETSGRDTVEEVEFNGSPRLFGRFTTSWGEQVGLYFDPDSNLLVGFDALDTEPMLGDVESRYILGNYEEVGGGLRLPHRMTVLKDDLPFSDVRYGSVTANGPDDATVFTMPEDLVSEADRAAGEEAFVPLTWNEVSNGVYHVVAYSHNSMVVEFPTFVAVVEAPYTESQSMALAALIRERIPEKPIRYAAITHPHWDHIGGVRGILAAGATLVLSAEHESQVRRVVDSPHSNPTDALERQRDAGTPTSIETFSGTWRVSDGPQTLELYEIHGSPHADPYVLAYLPASRTLFESDLFNPGTGAQGTPSSRHLETTIRNLRLDVGTIVGGHGGVGPLSELLGANNRGG